MSSASPILPIRSDGDCKRVTHKITEFLQLTEINLSKLSLHQNTIFFSELILNKMSQFEVF
jgi:hypothetical protein